MHIDSEKLSEQSAVPKVEVVMKSCLIISAVVGMVVIALAVVGKRTILEAAGSVIGVVALQWFFYTMVKAKRKAVETFHS